MIQKYKIKMRCFDDGYAPYWDEPVDLKFYGGKKRAMQAAKDMAQFEAEGWISILHKNSSYKISEMKDGFAVLKEERIAGCIVYAPVTEYHVLAA